MMFQLREHRHTTLGNSNIEFSKPTASVLRMDSPLVSATYAMAYCFRNFPRTYLHGKKIRVRWQGYTGYAGVYYARIEVLDGHYERSSMTDFPDQKLRILKESGTVILIKQYSTTFSWVIDTSGILDLSTCTGTDVCLFIRLYDWSGAGYRFYIDTDYVQILDASNNVLMSETFDDSVHMEVTGTYNDYGYISQDEVIIIDKSLEETYSLIELGVPLQYTLREKSITETYSLWELGAHYVVPYPYAPSNLIDLALQYAREAYEEFKTQNFGITEPLTPNAIRGTRYLRLREDLNKGARKASALMPDRAKRPMTFSILMACLYDIFHGRNPELAKTIYNETLRNYGIIPP